MNVKEVKAIAKRMMKIKKLQAEINKLKSGEMVPDEDDDESSHHNQKEEKEEIREIIRERIIEREPKPLPFIPNPYPRNPYYPDWKPRNPFYTRWRTTCNNLCLCSKNL